MRFTSALALTACSVAAKTAEEWKTRSVYQLLTDRFAKDEASDEACADLHNYCGGTFKGIENNLDYIAGMGFNAIWISPIPHNAEPDYHGYGAMDWERVNEHFGSDSDLVSLISACHERDIWVMLDVVANHTSYYANSDFSNINPFNKSEYYHTQCDIDWDDQSSVENCWLSGLPDLNQDNTEVREYLLWWIEEVVNTFEFDGIRIDTIVEVPKDFWTEYGESAGVFQMGEAFNGDAYYVADYQNYLTATFNYPMFFTARDVFGSGSSMYQLRSQYETEDKAFNNVDVLGSFVDNHDNARFLDSYPYNDTGFKSALVFSLTARGIPFFYYGDEQGFYGGNDPANRESLWNAMDTSAEIYQMVAKVNKARQSVQAWNYDYVERYVADNFFSYSYGDMLVMTTNSQDTVDIQMPYLPYSAGTEICNIFWPNDDCQTVTSSGIYAHLQGGESKIWLPKDSAYFTSQQSLFSQ